MDIKRAKPKCLASVCQLCRVSCNKTKVAHFYGTQCRVWHVHHANDVVMLADWWWKLTDTGAVPQTFLYITQHNTINTRIALMSTQLLSSLTSIIHTIYHCWPNTNCDCDLKCDFSVLLGIIWQFLAVIHSLRCEIRRLNLSQSVTNDCQPKQTDASTVESLLLWTTEGRSSDRLTVTLSSTLASFICISWFLILACYVPNAAKRSIWHHGFCNKKLSSWLFHRWIFRRLKFLQKSGSSLNS